MGQTVLETPQKDGGKLTMLGGSMEVCEIAEDSAEC